MKLIHATELDGAPITGICETLWKPGVCCPNKAEWIVKERESIGFAIMCGVHKDSFEQAYEANVEYLPFDMDLAKELSRKATGG